MPGAVATDTIVLGDARDVLRRLPDDSIDLSLWSPPYLVGKDYETDLSLREWTALVRCVLEELGRVTRPGAFTVVNIGDPRAWPDPELRGFQFGNPERHLPVTADDVRRMQERHPGATRHEIAARLGISEQTVSRRLKGTTHRRRRVVQTRVRLAGVEVDGLARDAGLDLYDYRIWKKPPCWSTCAWHAQSYRSVDEFEHVLMYRRPGPGTYRRDRLTRDEWRDWGSRSVWEITSVQANRRHPAEFPEELAERTIRLLSEPGEIVLDPFVGSGTTTAVARSLGRHWLGIERDPATAALARGRTEERAYDPIRKRRTGRDRPGASPAADRRP